MSFIILSNKTTYLYNTISKVQCAESIRTLCEFTFFIELYYGEKFPSSRIDRLNKCFGLSINSNKSEDQLDNTTVQKKIIDKICKVFIRSIENNDDLIAKYLTFLSVEKNLYINEIFIDEEYSSLVFNGIYSIKYKYYRKEGKIKSTLCITPSYGLKYINYYNYDFIKLLEESPEGKKVEIENQNKKVEIKNQTIKNKNQNIKIKQQGEKYNLPIGAGLYSDVLDNFTDNNVIKDDPINNNLDDPINNTLDVTINNTLDDQPGEKKINEIDFDLL